MRNSPKQLPKESICLKFKVESLLAVDQKITNFICSIGSILSGTHVHEHAANYKCKIAG